MNGVTRGENKPSQLLVTKLFVPTPRENLVSRPRLVERLDEVVKCRLLLLSAPPGFGKTTALSEWIARRDLHVGWLSLDEGDNDPIRFWTYVITALQHHRADLGVGLVSLLRPRRIPRLQAVLMPLVNELATLPKNSILVLDDYHLIQASEIHAGVAFLVDHLPPNLHLVIATRADPPLPVARWRARGELIELRSPDLRFSLEEATAFLKRVMGLSLSPEQLATLEGRTEGWIAGLQLAALSMQGLTDLAGFVHAFAGSHHFVLDYLSEEVLQCQSPELQAFLLQTCILDRMNASLADAVTGRNNSAQVLAQLEKANLFLVPLDDARQWYRYHHLFADILQSHLQQAHPDWVAELHRRASAWCEQNGFVNEAVGHALAVPDFERAGQLIDQAAFALLTRSEEGTLLTWVKSLPDDMVRARTSLCVWHATALVNLGQFELAEARFAQVDESQLDPLARGIAVALRAFIAFLHTDLPHAIEWTRNALTEAEGSSPSPADPEAEFKTTVILTLVTMLVEAQAAAGQLREAIASCRRGLKIGNSVAFAGLAVFVVVGRLHVKLAELLYEGNEIGLAAQHGVQGLEIFRSERNEEFESYALVALAQVKQAQGYISDAVELSEQAIQIGRKRNITLELRNIAAKLVEILIQQNRLEDAAHLLRELPLDDQAGWFMEAGLDSVARARVLIAQREFEQAALLLGSLQVQMQADGQMGTLIEALALLALARHGQGDTAQATTSLTRALSLAEPEGYVRTFVDLGETMRIMIAECRLQVQKENGDQRIAGYIDRLLAAFPNAHLESVPKSAHSNSKPEILPEPLSERELTVLRLIAEGLSNQQIAARLVVTLNTVKTHTYNIYGKLGVGSRTQALARARDLKLI